MSEIEMSHWSALARLEDVFDHDGHLIARDCGSFLWQLGSW